MREVRRLKRVLIAEIIISVFVFAIMAYGAYHARTYPAGGVSAFFCNDTQCSACAISAIVTFAVIWAILSAIFIVGTIVMLFRMRNVAKLPKLSEEVRLIEKGTCAVSGNLNFTFESKDGKRIHIPSFHPRFLNIYNTLIEGDEALLEYRESPEGNHIEALQFLRKKEDAWKCAACGAFNQSGEQCKYCKTRK